MIIIFLFSIGCRDSFLWSYHSWASLLPRWSKVRVHTHTIVFLWIVWLTVLHLMLTSFVACVLHSYWCVPAHTGACLEFEVGIRSRDWVLVVAHEAHMHNFSTMGTRDRELHRTGRAVLKHLEPPTGHTFAIIYEINTCRRSRWHGLGTVCIHIMRHINYVYLEI